MTPQTTDFAAIVNRVNCGGAKKETVSPSIETDKTTITITFHIKPKVSGPAPCEAAGGIEYQVHLDEPIGSRDLVDGQCHDGSVANGTSWCVDHGRRLTWREGQPTVPPQS